MRLRRTKYNGAMVSRSIAYRLVTAAVVVGVSAAAPGAALGHGFVHVRAAHQHAEAVESAQSARHGHPINGTGTVGWTGGGGGDHAHCRVDVAPTRRVETWAPAALAVAVATGFDPDLSVARSPLAQGGPERPTSPPGPPPKLRSPPLI